MRENERLSQLFDLSKKVAIITGAGSGLGRSFAEALAEAGATAVCVDINEETAKQTSEKIRDLGFESTYIKCDVSKENEVKSMFDKVVKDYGTVDILFNNAGIAGSNVAVHELSLEDWNKVIATDLTGVFLCAKEAVKIMKSHKSGKIINISSICGFIGTSPLIKDTAYHAAKGAIISFTREMALEYADLGINVNAIAPGFFHTRLGGSEAPVLDKALKPLIPMGKVGEPEDLKGTAIYLASKASDFMTGFTVVVDAGYIAG